MKVCSGLPGGRKTVGRNRVGIEKGPTAEGEVATSSSTGVLGRG